MGRLMALGSHGMLFKARQSFRFLSDRHLTAGKFHRLPCRSNRPIAVANA